MLLFYLQEFDHS